MSLGLALRRSYHELQQGWARLADSAFSRAAPEPHDEMARGEFISAFICEHGLNFPSNDAGSRPLRLAIAPPLVVSDPVLSPNDSRVSVRLR